MEHNPERPITGKDEDILAREGFIGRLSNALIQDNKATGVVIGLTGPWGSGKSSTLNMLHEKIKDDHGANSAVVRFNPWLITSKNDLINQFFSELIASIKQCHNVKYLRHYQFDLPKQLLEYAGAISPIMNSSIPGFSILAKPAADKAAQAIARDISIYDIKERIEKELKRVNYPIVVLIDELDRVEDDEVRVIAQLIKGIADFSNISYLVAYDEQRVIEALGNISHQLDETTRLERGTKYIEKIIQYPIPLPELIESDLVEMLIKGIKDILGERYTSSIAQKWNNSEERLNKLTSTIIPDLIKTPRDIKRIIGHFQILHALTGDKIDWIDVLGMSALQTKAPRTYSWLSNNVRMIIDMPDGMSSIRLRNELKELYPQADNRVTAEFKGDKTKIAIKETNLEKPLSPLIKILFPLFTSSGETPPYLTHESPAHNYYNLNLIITSGALTPPIPKSDIETFLTADRDRRISTINNQIQKDTIADFINLFIEIYSHRTIENEIEIWADLSEYFKQIRSPKDELKNTPPNEYLSERLADFLIDITEEGKKLHQLELTLINWLCSRNDYNIVPTILRRYIFSHGLYGKTTRENRTNISPKKISALCQTLAKPFIDDIRSGKDITFSAHMFYLAGDTQEWSEDHKLLIDKYITKEKNLLQLCALLYHDSKNVEPSFQIKIFHIENVYNRLKDLYLKYEHEEECIEKIIIYGSLNKIKEAINYKKAIKSENNKEEV